MKSPIKSLGILTFLFALTSIDPAHAGIVISDGELKSWTKENTTIYFHKGSAEAVDSDINLEDEPWWKDELTALTLARNLKNDLSQEQSYIDTLTGQTEVEFKFAFEYFLGDFISSHSVYSFFGTWDSTTDGGEAFDDKITDPGYSGEGTGWTFYWASTNPLNSSQVPEPSTAIAMSLLSVLGFAGNRRRRRTALNA